ncbi:MAG: hypothetical protein RI922_1763 [Bacteroidota bacterium]|jgi:hypothetical protein
MKIIIILLASLTFTLCAFSQKIVKTYWDYYNTKIQSEYYTNAYGVKNGSYKGYSQYGGILLQGTYKDDAPIGKWIENYLDGKLHYIKTYSTPGYTNFDVKDGRIISYYEDGKTIKYEKNFKNGELDGEYKEYNENGSLTLEGIYIKGVFERTGESKRIYDEEQAIKEKEALRKITIEYNKIIEEADKAFEVKDYKKALQWYQSASDLLVNEKYPKEKISEMIEKFNTSSIFIYDQIKAQNEMLNNDFKTLKAEFKIKTIVGEYNIPKQPVRVQSYSNYYHYEVSCNCEKPWDEETSDNALKCFETNKEFYEPYQKAITEAFFIYEGALTNEENNAERLNVSVIFEKTNYKFSTYDKTTFLNNLKVAKENFELSKAVKTNYLKAIENKANITNLNEHQKKKILFNKYLIVYEDLISKINAYASLAETTALLETLNSISDKVVALYNQETKDLEKKLKEAETSDQIQSIILVQ